MSAPWAKETRRERRERERSVPCTYCGAPKDEPCIGPNGQAVQSHGGGGRKGDVVGERRKHQPLSPSGQCLECPHGVREFGPRCRSCHFAKKAEYETRRRERARRRAQGARAS